MRIHLYGVQGSGSVFPRLREREASREVSEYGLLERVFEELERHTNADGRLDCRIDDLLGGPRDRHHLIAFRDRIMNGENVSYGGWTTCIHIETTGGIDLVFDCGSGFRDCAKDLQEKWGDRPERQLHLFGSHSHRDHTEGLDQAPVCFDPRNHIHVHGTYQFIRALDEHLGIFSRRPRGGSRRIHTPVTYKLMPTRFFGHLIETDESRSSPQPQPLAKIAHSTYGVEEPFEIGDARITPFELFHTGPCLGYCVESGGKKFVFATDHELRRPDPDETDRSSQEASEAAEARLIHYATGADVLYRDGQYLRSEYDGEKGIGESRPLVRRDWGHTCIEDVEEMARECQIKHTLIGHHDPNREWAERRWIDQSLSRNAARDSRIVELAKAETVIEL